MKDHLGSASVVTDASGVTVGEQRYYPYGETRVTSGTIYTDKLFTGQREMAGLGIYHYNARFYSPKLGRFLSPDTIVPSYTNPQHLNRFGYVLNNPLRYTDPTGHMDQVPDDGGCAPCNELPSPLPGPEPEPLPNFPPYEGPIFEFPTEPMPIIIGGPILGPIDLPELGEPAACAALKNKVTRLSAKVSSIIQSLDKLSEELDRTTDPEKRKAIQQQMDKLTAERDSLWNEIGKLYLLGQAAGCDVNNW